MPTPHTTPHTHTPHTHTPHTPHTPHTSHTPHTPHTTHHTHTHTTHPLPPLTVTNQIRRQPANTFCSFTNRAPRMLPGQPVSTTSHTPACIPSLEWHEKKKKEEKLKEQLFMQPSRLEPKCRTGRTMKRRLSVTNLSSVDNLLFIHAEAN